MISPVRLLKGLSNRCQISPTHGVVLHCHRRISLGWGYRLGLEWKAPPPPPCSQIRRKAPLLIDEYPL